MRTQALIALSAVAISATLVTPAQATHQQPPAPQSGTLAAAVEQPAASPPGRGHDYVPGRILVAPKPGIHARALGRIHASLGAKPSRPRAGTGIREVQLPAGVSVAQALRRYAASGDVAYAEPDYLITAADLSSATPNDPLFPTLYGLHNQGQVGGTADADVDAPEAWATTTGSPDTVIAVLDSAVDVAHPDLRDNIWRNAGEVAGNGIDDDGNGYVDDVHGWDFVDNDASVAHSSTQDMHGTHVAGIIAARGNNAVGVTGVARQAGLMPLRILDENGSGTVSAAIKALDYAIANGARVSNNSWGGAPYSKALHDAIKRADGHGHLFVAAAGNGGPDRVGDDLDAAPEYPASYPEENILTVAATDADDTLAAFSNYGSGHVDLAAPGVAIGSTTPGNTYTSLSGTSSATPYVTGAAALLLSVRPELTAPRLRRALLETADPLPTLAGKTASGGRLNAHGAVHHDVTTEPITEPEPAPSPEPAPEEVAAPAATELALSASRRIVPFRQRVRFTGALTAEGEPVAKQPVTLERRWLGTRRWRPIAAETVTGADGGFALPGLRLRRNADYRVRFAGTDSWEPSLSPTRRVRVRARVSERTAAQRVPVGDVQRVSGRVAPRRAGRVRVVVVRHGQVVKRTWVRLRDRSYTFAYQPRRPGRYVVRAIRPADRRNLGARQARSFRATRSAS